MLIVCSVKIFTMHVNNAFSLISCGNKMIILKIKFNLHLKNFKMNSPKFGILKVCQYMDIGSLLIHCIGNHCRDVGGILAALQGSASWGHVPS